MSHTLIKVIWQIMTAGHTDRKISYHESISDVSKFICHERARNPHVRYGREQLIHTTVSCSLLMKVKEAKLKDIYGIWDTQDSVITLQF